MTILFTGCTVADFGLTESTDVYDTDMSVTDSNPSSIKLTQTSSATGYPRLDWSPPSPVKTLWIHHNINFFSGSSSDTASSVSGIITFFNSAGTEIFTLDVTNQVVTPKCLHGGSMTSFGKPTAWTVATWITLDVGVDIAGGTVEVYLGGNQIGSYSGNLSAMTDIAKVSVRQQLRYIDEMVSAILVADSSTVGFNVAWSYPNAAGSKSDWSGSYSDVSATSLPSAGALSASSAGQTCLFKAAMPSLSTGSQVKGVVLSSNLAPGTSGPKSVEHTLGNGKTTASGAGTKLKSGYQNVQTVFAQNPITSAKWATSDLSTLQFGMTAET